MNMFGRTPVLHARKLVYAYPGQQVLNGFTAEFHAGLTWLKGANGSGKSTLLKILAGVLEPQSGTRVVMDIDAARQPFAYRRNVFWCGPDSLPFDHLLAMEYLGFIQGLYPTFDGSAVPHYLDELGLREQLGTPIGRMSTGTKRKVWLVAALASGVPVVILDEPLNALDHDALSCMRRYFDRMAIERQQCLIVASHESPCTNTSQVSEMTLESNAANPVGLVEHAGMEK